MTEHLSSISRNSQWGQTTGQDNETIAHLQRKLTQASQTLLEKHIVYKEAVATAEQLVRWRKIGNRSDYRYMLSHA
ncbi:hypothetical protein [Acaryochloris sp. IP29b_bin.137]|uniref:hypothetical protein n=1 Tax=Acaryochloris sp. IP29b_bin.137 TaxID=2969217 RepID=UPI00260BA9A4|nr:hypothetical protein [Acaryochloris sp. IP29b_bin.137]